MSVKRIADIASAEIGTSESPANSNRTKYGKDYGWDGVAWCVIFVWWIFNKAGLDHLLPKKTASCSVMIEAAKRAGLWVEVKEGLRPGDVVFYRFGKQNHVGYLTSIAKSTVTSIEGNTGVGNDANGGCVMRRTRNISYVVGALRPKYETVKAKKHIALVAQECADGKGGWGVGDERKAALSKDGYDPAKVQSLVNALMKDGIRATVAVSDSGVLNLRNSPTTEKSKVIRSFHKGAVLRVSEIKEGPGASAWGKTRGSDGTGALYSGWVSMDWVEV